MQSNITSINYLKDRRCVTFSDISGDHGYVFCKDNTVIVAWRGGHVCVGDWKLENGFLYYKYDYMNKWHQFNCDIQSTVETWLIDTELLTTEEK